jgi:hypothetical protein
VVRPAAPDLIDLASELGFFSGAAFEDLNPRSERICAQLEALLQTMERKVAEEEAPKEQRLRIRRASTQ